MADELKEMISGMDKLMSKSRNVNDHLASPSKRLGIEKDDGDG